MLPKPPRAMWADSFQIPLLCLFMCYDIDLGFGLNFPWSNFISLLQILSPFENPEQDSPFLLP